LLKRIKGRWACLPLDFRFYLMQKDIKAKGVTVRRDGAVVAFETKMDQAAAMLKALFAQFRQPVLVVTDSWFGNDGLWSRLARGRDGDFQLLSRLRSNLTLYGLIPTPASGEPPRRGRPRKYGARLGSVAQCALAFRACAVTYQVLLYGKQRELLAYSQVVMLKTMKCPVRVVWVFRQSRYVALATTDLSLRVEQIIEFYGARWKIEIYQSYCLYKAIKWVCRGHRRCARRLAAWSNGDGVPGDARAGARVRPRRPRSATAVARHAEPGARSASLCAAS
jgi:hypothetical protein